METHIASRNSISTMDVAELRQSADGEYSMSRVIRPRDGHTYEVTASRYREQGVTSFAEARAIALTLPAYVAALAETNRMPASREDQTPR
jgi:hypothetical protein